MNENKPASINILFSRTHYIWVNIYTCVYVDVEDWIFLIIISYAGKQRLDFGEPPYFLSNSHLKQLLELQIAPIFLLLSPASI